MIILKGEKIVPDIVHEYTPKVRNGTIPIVIDNGNKYFVMPCNCFSDSIFIYKEVISVVSDGLVTKSLP